MAQKRRKKRRKNNQNLLVIAALAVCVAALIGVGIGIGRLTADRPSDGDTTPSTTTTTTTAPTTTTTTTTAPTTTTTTTAKPTGGATATTLMQYDTTGRYVQPAGAPWQLMLVNDWNPMPANYNAGVTMAAVGGRNQYCDPRIKDAVNALLQAGAAYGIDVQSGYRSASHQGTLYWRQVNNYVNQGKSDAEAQRIAGTIVKRPGYSEHNTGLAVDLGGSGNFNLTTDFENTPAFKWLIENCADYGFILRFPKGKEDITGVIYEAWHFRYVGVDVAREIMSRGICLEEYLAASN